MLAGLLFAAFGSGKIYRSGTGDQFIEEKTEREGDRKQKHTL